MLWVLKVNIRAVTCTVDSDAYKGQIISISEIEACQTLFELRIISYQAENIIYVMKINGNLTDAL